MTLLSLVNTKRVTLLTDELVVPADRIDAIGDLGEAARALSTLHEGARERVVEAEREARERGHADGAALAGKRSAEQLAERLLVLEGRVEREREALRVRTTDIALRIVRRVAAELGEEATLAALARQAARELLPSARIVVQVHPDHLAGVRARLGTEPDGRGHSLDTELVVEPEESLAPDQCRLRSSGGVAVLAGLETQLGVIERRAAAATATSGDAVPDAEPPAPEPADAPSSAAPSATGDEAAGASAPSPVDTSATDESSSGSPLTDGETAQDETPQGEPSPSETVPEETLPDETSSGETARDETPPDEPSRGEPPPDRSPSSDAPASADEPSPR